MEKVRPWWTYVLTTLLGICAAWLTFITVNMIKTNEWRSSFIGYPRDARDFETRIMEKVNREIATAIAIAAAENKSAVRELTDAVNKLNTTVSRLEGTMLRNQP